MKSYLAALALAGVLAASVPAAATQYIFVCHDHPDGNRVPPAYGLRIDNLLATAGDYTFSFDYVDGTGSAGVTLMWDDVTGTIHITGRAYGGLDTGTGWDPALRGWIDIDFTYSVGVNTQDDCSGTPGDDAYVTTEDPANGGTITLLGWGGGGVYAFQGKANGSGCAFILDNDADPKGNAAIAGDPATWSGSGWLQPTTSGSRDWLFIANAITLPVHETTWGALKAIYR